MTDTKTVAIIGAGPVGLAAAVHALDRGLKPVVLEKGPEVGHAMEQWNHVEVFSPWAFNVDRLARQWLEVAGWQMPPLEAYPTAGEIVEKYLRPLAALDVMKPVVQTGCEVIDVSRTELDKVRSNGRDDLGFEVRFRRAGSPVEFETLKADAIVDASGTWFGPNPAGSNGLPALGEKSHGDKIDYGMPDVPGRLRGTYARQKTAVLGGGHSAIGTVVELAKLAREEAGTKVIWLVRARSLEKSFGGGDNDQLAARGALGTTVRKLIEAGEVEVVSGFRLGAIDEQAGGLALHEVAGSEGRVVEADRLVVSTGFRPDFSFLREVRLDLDPALECPSALAPLIDPNIHSCGTVRPHGARELVQPDKGFYIAGMKSYGRAPTFLMMTGYEQVRSIMAEIAGDQVAARRIELVLPETGVCSGPGGAKEDEGGCCGPVTDKVEETVSRGCC